MHPLRLGLEPQAPCGKATETIQRIPHDGKMMPRGGFLSLLFSRFQLPIQESIQ